MSHHPCIIIQRVQDGATIAIEQPCMFLCVELRLEDVRHHDIIREIVIQHDVLDWPEDDDWMTVRIDDGGLDGELLQALDELDVTYHVMDGYPEVIPA